MAQYLLESYIERGKGAEFNAFVSQPRRISAISLAERVANERGEDIGESVGYGVRWANLRQLGKVKVLEKLKKKYMVSVKHYKSKISNLR